MNRELVAIVLCGLFAFVSTLIVGRGLAIAMPELAPWFVGLSVAVSPVSWILGMLLANWAIERGKQ